MPGAASCFHENAPPTSPRAPHTPPGPKGRPPFQNVTSRHRQTFKDRFEDCIRNKCCLSFKSNNPLPTTHRRGKLISASRPIIRSARIILLHLPHRKSLKACGMGHRRATPATGSTSLRLRRRRDRAARSRGVIQRYHMGNVFQTSQRGGSRDVQEAFTELSERPVG